MSSESGKLQLKVNPNADRNYFPASEIENFDKKKKGKRRKNGNEVEGL